MEIFTGKDKPTLNKWHHIPDQHLEELRKHISLRTYFGFISYYLLCPILRMHGFQNYQKLKDQVPPSQFIDPIFVIREIMATCHSWLSICLSYIFHDKTQIWQVKFSNWEGKCNFFVPLSHNKKISTTIVWYTPWLIHCQCTETKFKIRENCIADPWTCTTIVAIELHAPTNSTQKLKLMGKGRQFTYIPTLPLTWRLPQTSDVE